MPLREIDRQLLDRCLKHEPGAWNDFVDRYMGLIYHTIHGLVGQTGCRCSATRRSALRARARIGPTEFSGMPSCLPICR